MAKYDAVDRLMKMATDTPTKSSVASVLRSEERDAEAVLEARVSAAEPLPKAGTASVPSSRALAPAPPSPSERGRQIMSAVRPFLPAVGSALRLVDHGAVQALARLLPVLGNAAAFAGSSAAPETTGATPAPMEALAQAEKQQAALREEIKAYRLRLEIVEEQLRRVRENLERTVAEQGSLAHQAHQLADRTRLLTAAVIILGMMVVAALVLVGISLHR